MRVGRCCCGFLRFVRGALAFSLIEAEGVCIVYDRARRAVRGDMRDF